MGSIADFPSSISSTYQVSSFTSDMDLIWSRLIAAGLSEVAAAGVMGNMYHESHCTGTAVNLGELHRHYGNSYTANAYIQNIDNHTISEYGFVHDAVGFGLVQWTYYSRKQQLYDSYELFPDLSISSVSMQMWHLLNNDTTFAGVRASYLDSYTGQPGTQTNIISASDDFYVWFEASGYNHTDGTGTKRASYAYDIYQHYTGTSPGPDPDPPTPDYHSITVTVQGEGRYTINKRSAKSGETIRIAARPMNGTVLQTVPDLILTYFATGWSFIMPDANVAATLIFVQKKREKKKRHGFKWYIFRRDNGSQNKRRAT